jgi:hypothetical protein
MIGLSPLNGVPLKHNDLQGIAFVPEMSHSVVRRGRIFTDQLIHHPKKLTIMDDDLDDHDENTSCSYNV